MVSFLPRNIGKISCPTDNTCAEALRFRSAESLERSCFLCSRCGRLARPNAAQCLSAWDVCAGTVVVGYWWILYTTLYELAGYYCTVWAGGSLFLVSKYCSSADGASGTKESAPALSVPIKDPEPSLSVFQWPRFGFAMTRTTMPRGCSPDGLVWLVVFCKDIGWVNRSSMIWANFDP